MNKIISFVVLVALLGTIAFFIFNNDQRPANLQKADATSDKDSANGSAKTDDGDLDKNEPGNETANWEKTDEEWKKILTDEQFYVGLRGGSRTSALG